jgi:LysR family transcriptional activator of nhaA
MYAMDIRPKIVNEFQATALMKAFGQDGIGMFPGPTVIEKEICRQSSVRVVGRVVEVTENYSRIGPPRNTQVTKA